MTRFPASPGRRWIRAALATALLAAMAATVAHAQNTSPAEANPSDALSDALTAACQQNAGEFAQHLTTRNAAAMQELPAAERTALMRRFVLLNRPGRPLLSTSDNGHAVLRCEAAGLVSEMRFGATQTDGNLAFIRVEIPQASGPEHSVRFGLVRQGKTWKLLSVGLLLLDLPMMEQQWKQADADARESEAIAALHKIATALKAYQQAYGKLPDNLQELGPAPAGSIAPERAGLLNAQLASGNNGNYHFRYTIAPSNAAGDQSDRNKAARFILAAIPDVYGKSGRRSFCLAPNGVLHGADKHGAVATVDDPIINPPQP